MRKVNLAVGPRGQRRLRATNWDWLAWLSLPAMLLVWLGLSRRLPAYLLPSPWQVARQALLGWQDGSLVHHLGASMLREMSGFALAAGLGLVLGLAMGLSAALRALMAPINSVLMSIPPIAWTPLLMLFWGLGDPAMVAVIVLASASPMAITLQEGVQSIHAGEVRAARTLGASRGQLLRHVYLPACLPAVTAALRLGFSQAWRALVAAEMIGASDGIGWMVSTGGQVGNTSQVLLGMALIALIAYLAERLLFRRLESRYRHWRGQ